MVRASLTIAAVLSLAGCGGADAPPVAPENASAGIEAATALPTPEPSPSPSAAATPTAEADDPVAVVRAYARHLEAGQAAEAYALWRPEAIGMSESAFAAAFQKYQRIEAEVGAPGRIDAGAGQRYVTVPLTLTGELTDGRPFRLEGPVTLRKAGDIDGATPAQRRWRIADSALKPRPG